MINLLTEEGRTAILSEYRQRRGRVALWWLFIILVTGLVMIGSLIFQIKSRQQETILTLGQTTTDDKKIPNANDEKILRRANLEIVMLKSLPTSELMLNDHWQLVLKNKPAGIKLTDWLWDPGGAKDKTITLSLSGQATTRQTLLDFIEKLKQEPTFLTVDSPVANLIKSHDLGFNLKLTIAKNEK